MWRRYRLLLALFFLFSLSARSEVVRVDGWFTTTWLVPVHLNGSDEEYTLAVSNFRSHRLARFSFALATSPITLGVGVALAAGVPPAQVNWPMLRDLSLGTFAAGTALTGVIRAFDETVMWPTLYPHSVAEVEAHLRGRAPRASPEPRELSVNMNGLPRRLLTEAIRGFPLSRREQGLSFLVERMNIDGKWVGGDGPRNADAFAVDKLFGWGLPDEHSLALPPRAEDLASMSCRGWFSRFLGRYK